MASHSFIQRKKRSATSSASWLDSTLTQHSQERRTPSPAVGSRVRSWVELP